LIENDILLLDVDSHDVATLTLNRPHLRNAFDDVLIQRLTATLKDLRDNIKPRVMVLRGAGPSFCAGADLSWMKRSATFTESQNLEDARELALLMYTLDTLPFPTVAYAHGAVFGGGVGLIACCDVVLAAESTIFSLSETRLGLVPAVISPYVVRAMGVRNARRYMLSGERFFAFRAQRIGLVHEVIDHMESEYLLYETIGSMLKGGPKSQSLTKKLIQDVSQGNITEEIRIMTSKLIAEVRASEEAQSGMDAHFKKKKPSWAPDEGYGEY